MKDQIKYPVLYDAMSQYAHIPLEAYIEFESGIYTKEISQGDFLFREGQTINFLTFINEGLGVNYRLDQEGNYHVLQIRGKGWWLGDLHSFFTSKPSHFNVMCFKKTEFLIINRPLFDKIVDKYHVFDRFFRVAFQKSYVGTLEKLYDLHSKNATQRYTDLVSNVPDLVDHIPHYLIASYLNIQPQSLSRIRSQLKKSGKD